MENGFAECGGRALRRHGNGLCKRESPNQAEEEDAGCGGVEGVNGDGDNEY